MVDVQFIENSYCDNYSICQIDSDSTTKANSNLLSFSVSSRIIIQNCSIQDNFFPNTSLIVVDSSQINISYSNFTSNTGFNGSALFLSDESSDSEC